jgi:hypothetical protein
MSPTKKRFTDIIKPDLLLQNGQTGPAPFKYNRTINRDRRFKDDLDQGSLDLLIRWNFPLNASASDKDGYLCINFDLCHDQTIAADLVFCIIAIVTRVFNIRRRYTAVG